MFDKYPCLAITETVGVTDREKPYQKICVESI